MTRRIAGVSFVNFTVFLTVALFSAAAHAGVDTNSSAYKAGELVGELIGVLIGVLVVKKLFFSKK